MSEASKKIIRSEMLFSQAKPESLAGKIVLFPLSRILITILFLAPVGIIHFLFDLFILQVIPQVYKPVAIGFDIVISFGLFIFLYTLYTKFIEKRTAYEFSVANGIRDSFYGLILGGGIISILILFLTILGYYKVNSFNAEWSVAFNGLLSLGMAAFVEELLFRVIIFKLTEEFCGTWIALVTSILYFGFAHAGNPNATLWSSIAIGVEAGILLTAAFMLTRTIWFPLAIHFGWNYFQAKIFGVTTSGVSVNGLIQPEISGPGWLTGGDFGIEASVATVLFCLVISFIILKKAIINNQIIVPMWQRKKMSPTSDLSQTA